MKSAPFPMRAYNYVNQDSAKAFDSATKANVLQIYHTRGISRVFDLEG